MFIKVGNTGINLKYGQIDVPKIFRGRSKIFSANALQPSLLLHFDGSNGSTSFFDDSAYGHAITANGDAQISTTQKKVGRSSLALDGTGDYLSISSPPESLVKWFDGDYTLEAWVYLAGNPTNGANGHSTLIGNSFLDSNGEYWSFGPLNNRTVRFYYWNGAQNSVTTSTALNLSEWYHLAFVKNGSNIKIYINGIESASQAVSGTPTSGSAGPFTIGRVTNTGAFNGYVDELRIVRGEALYTSNFTPRTSPFPDPIFPTATGGVEAFHVDEITGLPYKSHTFNDIGSANLTFTRGGVAEYLVVGGGASGSGRRYGGSEGTGGGGAGGVVLNRTIFGEDTFNITVGAGGARAGVNLNFGNNGSNSSLGEIIAIGGGGGTNGAGGQAGGSGGGSGGGGGSSNGGDGLQPSSSSGGFGNRGGYSQTFWKGGGGGGAGAIGGSASSGVGGNGGIGISSSISGTSTYYGGGGGGGQGGIGGLGGGANSNSQNATSGTGGGGSGAPGYGEGGAGGSGTVIVRYRIKEQDNLPFATGGIESFTRANDAIYKVHTFTDTDPTSLLLNFDGANGSTTFTDDSGWGHAVTANGNAQISTTQSRFGGSSLYLDGNGDYVDVPYSPLFSFGTADWTVEAMVYFAADVLLPVAALGTGIQASPSHKSAWSLYLSTSGITLDRFDGVTQTQKSFGGFSLPLNEWFHIAVCRDGGNLRAFVDGVQKGSTATSLPTYAAVNTTDPLRIGYLYAGSANYYGNGYIDSLRITKGQALYTSNFTPSTTAFTRVGSGSLTFERGGDVEYLVVGGGGGGGFRGGGGGAGGFRNGLLSVTDSNNIITVGDGGEGAITSTLPGYSGSDSIFDTISSAGGGGGGSFNYNNSAGVAGGSGGGASYIGSGGTGQGGAGNTPSTVPSQGNSGGTSIHVPGSYGGMGGGGGAGAAGGNASAQTGGAGGAGSVSSISGSSITYAGGGGAGGAASPTNWSRGVGGVGGGGDGSVSSIGAPGTTNTGGGGGGGGSTSTTAQPGGKGGSGIVIVRYKIYDYST